MVDRGIVVEGPRDGTVLVDNGGRMTDPLLGFQTRRALDQGGDTGVGDAV